MAVKYIDELDVSGKKVIMRVDFNVPVKDGIITDDNRIRAALPSIKYVVENGGKAILLAHFSRIKTEDDKKNKSLKIVSEKLAELIGKDVKFVPHTRGSEVENAVSSMSAGEIVMLENTRFEDVENGEVVKKESKCDDDLGKYWASLGDLFVNDAFGTAHRAHASNVGIAKNLPSAAGYLMKKEIEFIGGTVDNPEKPLVAILGGAKVSDKIGVIESLLEKADKIIIGGAMMFTFLKAQGKNTGKSLVEEDKIELAKSLMEKAKANNVELVLPIDTIAAKEFKNDTEFRTVSVDDMADDELGLDIGKDSVSLFAEKISGAKTVVWNGPMGVFEMENFAQGTIGVCKAIAELADAKTIIGGGDSAAAAEQLGFAEKFSHISTGGGASLEYLEGKELPGIVSLNQ
jgi:phosphoglycerate kinase